MFYKSILRPVFFLIPPETVHNLVVFVLRIITKFKFIKFLLQKYFVVESPELHRTVAGIKFKNPVGLAAGFDKKAEIIDGIEALGFGFMEIGTITPLPQSGNEKPRVFRLIKDKALINRMGFNNIGCTESIKNLKSIKKRNIIIGGNIGKNKITPIEQASSDYIKCIEQLCPYIDYFTLNISSPNTPELRKLQNKNYLYDLLKSIVAKIKETPEPKPVFVKIAPDLDTQDIDDIIELVNTFEIAGIIATNTTIARDNLQTDYEKVKNAGEGGLSGQPLKQKSNEIIKHLRSGLKKEKAIMAVGGIFTNEDAFEKLNAGADLIQVYTGFIYEGPAIARRINKAIIDNT
jgi:dihydroorotate dehydrogenase